MINSKHFNKTVFVLIILSLLFCALIVYLAYNNQNTKIVEYESRLFGDDILTIDIQVDEEEWQGLLDNPEGKEYIPADLIINGEKFSGVGLRTKGNSSLTQVAQMSDSDRYSLNFKFNKYQKGQTYYGLDSFCLNNIIGDNTYMKDYLSYDIMKYIGVPTPLMNYAKVTINGEYYGFCLALERYEKSFLDRVYDTSGGQLYNVKIQMGQRDNFMDINMGENNAPQNPPDENFQLPSKGEFSEENFKRGDMNNRDGAQGFNRGMPGGRGGGDLVYTDDSISSYSAIFDNAEFKKNSDNDKEQVINAIKNLNEGTDLEEYFDVDEILRYLAAHTVLVNLDSYSSSMAQNYYIYERNGKISILPWDYNLSFGGFQSSSASSVINFPIDTPVSGVSMEDRPLISKLLEVPDYKEKYHEYLRQIVDGYFKSGVFEETVRTLDAKINEYVKNDTTSFTTYEKYIESLSVIKKLGLLRAQSIEGQLDGTVPSTTEEQTANKDSLISGEDISISALGSFMGGGGGNNRNQDRQNNQDRQDWQDRPTNPDEGNFENRESPRGRGDIPGSDDSGSQDWPINPDEGNFENRENPQGRGSFPRPDNSDMQGKEAFQSATSENKADKTYIIFIAILLLLVLTAIFFLSKVKKKY